MFKDLLKSCRFFIFNDLIVGDGDLDLYTRFDRDTGDLFDDLGRRVKIDYSLVYPHLEAIPSLGTFTARSFTGRDSQDFGRHAHRSLNLQLLLLRSIDQLFAD